MSANLPEHHGVRATYLRGCKCFDCRKANSIYSCERAALVKEGRGNPLMDASAARAHILALSKKGLGYRQLERRSGVSRRVITDLKKGVRTRARRVSIEAILAVTPDMRYRPHVYVSAKSSHLKLKHMRDEGYTLARISQELGIGRLQLDKKRVTIVTRDRIADLYRRLMK